LANMIPNFMVHPRGRTTAADPGGRQVVAPRPKL
jgi:hypothetical protein